MIFYLTFHVKLKQKVKIMEEIGPYIRQTKLFDEFFGFYMGDDNIKRKVVIQIFHYIYNLPKATIKRIKAVLDKLKECPYVQEFIKEHKDKDTGIDSLIYQYYPKSAFTLHVEPIDYFTKLIPSFIYKGILCLQYLRNQKICHHDICLENIYFGNPVGNDDALNPDDLNDSSKNDKKTVNQNPLKYDFRLLNWAFATIDNNAQSHKISIVSRYQFKNQNLSNHFEKDPYKHDIWDFGITVFSLFDKENVPELIKLIDDKFPGPNKTNFEIAWDELLKNYHPYPEHCKKVKKFFEKLFTLQNSGTILTNLIFSNLFSYDFFQDKSE